MLKLRHRNSSTGSTAIAKDEVRQFDPGPEPTPPETKVDDIVSGCNVTVMSGSSSREFPVAKQKVGDVRKLLKAVLNVADDAIALVNGAESGEEVTLAANDRLEFVRRAGMKGGACY